MSASIELVGVRKTYSSDYAVRDVSLKVEAGEFFTLLGPCGSGKTTTLMMIAGSVEPDAEDILIGGRSMLNPPPERRNLGVVFQNYALFPNVTVAQNVSFSLRMRHLGRGIQRQLRLTVNYVAHDQYEALALSDRIAVMASGVVEQMGPAAEEYERPQTMFVGQSLGESNVVDGCVVRCHGDCASVEPKGGAGTVEAVVPSGAVGDAVRLLIRPEMISLGPEVGSVGNSVRARVRTLDYLGSSIRYMVDTPGGLRHLRSASAGHNHL